jgi:hypothetical protein
MPKVTSVLRDLLGFPIDERAVDCLKENLAGNLHLQRNELYSAIESYDRALAVAYGPQEGVLLSMRSEAYLARAFAHRVAVDQLRLAATDPALAFEDRHLGVLFRLPLVELCSPSGNIALLAVFVANNLKEVGALFLMGCKHVGLLDLPHPEAGSHA